MKENIFFEKLIKYWCEDEGFFGLTIPFLVGAEKKETGRKHFDINLLLEEIRISDNKYVISFCKEMDEFIIGTHKSNYPNINSLKSYNSLLINKEKLEFHDSFKELKDCLIEKYSEKIKNNDFSKDYYTKKWSYFTKKDLETIQKANQ